MEIIMEIKTLKKTKFSMDLLKEIANDRLVVMATHNPELAEQYSTRIIRLLDGQVIDDTDPYSRVDDLAEKAKFCVTDAKDIPLEDISYKEPKKKKDKSKKKNSMSFFTALSLSLNNLMTKKARTALTSFAGSIGIIGIALILSISSGSGSPKTCDISFINFLIFSPYINFK